MTSTRNLAVPTSPALKWETFFSAILRDGAQPDTCDLTAISSADFLAACTAHGVAPLIHRELHQCSALAAWPAALQTALTNQVHLHAAMDALREQELRVVLDAFAHCGVQPLLMKSTPLAYTHYAASDLRPRSDTDMLIARADCEAAHQALIDLGYTPIAFH